MQFLNPKTDFAFKKIFGSEESGEILVSFLNAILSLAPPRLITEVRILDPYLAPRIKGMKDTYLDVRVKDQSLREYIIEMQVLNVAGFEKRVLYNACKAYVGQIQKGEDFLQLNAVVALTITDFIMFGELPGQINWFRLRADDHQEIAIEDLDLVFAELPKFDKQEEQLDDIVDKWLFFLKHAGHLDMVPKPLSTVPAIRKAFDLANKAGLTPEELDDQERREYFIYHQRTAMLQAEQRGQQKGWQEGRQEGRREQAASILLLLLQNRFGNLPDWVASKVNAAGVQELERWTPRILSAKSMDDIFGTP